MSDERKSPLRAAIEGDELVIRIGTGTLCYAVQQDAGTKPAVTITDEAAFLQWFARHLLDFDQDEAGASAIERVFDNLALDAAEGAENFMADDSRTVAGTKQEGDRG